MGSRAGFDFRVEYFKQIYLQYLNIFKKIQPKRKTSCGFPQYGVRSVLVLQNQN